MRLPRKKDRERVKDERERERVRERSERERGVKHIEPRRVLAGDVRLGCLPATKREGDGGRLAVNGMKKKERRGGWLGLLLREGEEMGIGGNGFRIFNISKKIFIYIF